MKGDVKVAARVLSRYAGNYQMEQGDVKVKATLSVTGAQLMFSLGGKGVVPLTTLSETSFFFPGGFPLDLDLDAKGSVTNFLLHAPCGDFKFVRPETAGKIVSDTFGICAMIVCRMPRLSADHSCLVA